MTLLALFTTQQIVRRNSMITFEDQAHQGVIAVLSAFLWLFVSRWVGAKIGGGHMLTASWAALALVFFGAGFILREKMYRWFGRSSWRAR